MSVLRISSLIQLRLNISTSSQLSLIKYIAHHTFQCSLRFILLVHWLPHAWYLKQFISSNGSQFSLKCIRPSFAYHELLITVLLPTFTLNCLLSHTLLNSLTSLHNFSSETATSAVSSANYLPPSTNNLPPSVNSLPPAMIF